MLELTATQQVKPSISVNSKADVIRWDNIPYSSDNTKSFYSLYSPSATTNSKKPLLDLAVIRNSTDLQSRSTLVLETARKRIQARVPIRRASKSFY
jgi:hypothetical protein